MGIKAILSCLWIGMTLSSMFFYPLLSTLHDHMPYMQWQPHNSLELFLAYTLISCTLAVYFLAASRISREVLRLAVILPVSAVCFGSFIIHLCRQLGYTGLMIRAGHYFGVQHALLVGLALLGIVTAALVIGRCAKKTLAVINTALLVISPITIVALWTILSSSRQDTVTCLRYDAIAGRNIGAPLPPRRSICVFLFDEMSYEFLYEDHDIRPAFPNIRSLAATSDNYHWAKSPGKSTLTAVPGLLSGQAASDSWITRRDPPRSHDNPEETAFKVLGGNLFGRAQEQGFKTIVFGPFFPYCEMFGGDVDECHSFSIYNYASVGESFSWVNPVLSNFIFWPSQAPVGWPKRRVYAAWQRNMTAQLVNLTLAALESDNATFLYTHFYLPHLPFTFDRGGAYENPNPFLESPENYTRQLEYVDKLLGMLLDSIKRQHKWDNSEVVVLSDHNLRIAFPPDQQDHVPLLVKKYGQSSRRDIQDPVAVKAILSGLLQ